MKIVLPFLVCSLFSFVGSQAIADVSGILVPAYANPTFSDDGPAMWEALVDTAERADRNFEIRAVVNPFSGPGPMADQSDYNEDYFGADGNFAGTRFRAAGGQTLGYVWTDRGRRDVTVVIEEIDASLDATGAYAGNFDGIFLDDFYDGQEDLMYYQTIFDHMQTEFSAAIVVGNVGDVGGLNELSTAQASSLLSPLDTLVSHEMPPVNDDPFSSDYLNKFTPLTHASLFADAKYAHLLHDAGSTWDESFLDLANSRGPGWFYATPDSGDNPWDNFDPVFWNDFTNSVNAVPEPGSIVVLAGGALGLFLRRRGIAT